VTTAFGRPPSDEKISRSNDRNLVAISQRPFLHGQLSLSHHSSVLCRAPTALCTVDQHQNAPPFVAREPRFDGLLRLSCGTFVTFANVRKVIGSGRKEHGHLKKTFAYSNCSGYVRVESSSRSFKIVRSYCGTMIAKGALRWCRHRSDPDWTRFRCDFSVTFRPTICWPRAKCGWAGPLPKC
jgi:hypothetical protein